MHLLVKKEFYVIKMHGTTIKIVKKMYNFFLAHESICRLMLLFGKQWDTDVKYKVYGTQKH